VTRSITVYGFGSAFAEPGVDKPVTNDFDLLLVHPGTDATSCQFAIACKRRLSAFVDRAHITMLSDGEEQHCGFIRTAQAVPLGSIRADSVEVDVDALIAAMPKHGKR
jgi:hypothetical protein